VDPKIDNTEPPTARAVAADRSGKLNQMREGSVQNTLAALDAVIQENRQIAQKLYETFAPVILGFGADIPESSEEDLEVSNVRLNLKNMVAEVQRTNTFLLRVIERCDL